MKAGLKKRKPCFSGRSRSTTASTKHEQSRHLSHEPRRSAEAVAAFERAIALHPTGLSHRENLGRALLLSGDPERAAAVLQRVVAHPDHGPDAELDLCESLARSGKWAEAEVIARGAHARFPADTRFHLLLAVALRRKGALAETERVFRGRRLANRLDPVVRCARRPPASDRRASAAARVAGGWRCGAQGTRSGRHLEAFRRGEVPR
jgi:tetratricopeptide (TPR) repeat protein